MPGVWTNTRRVENEKYMENKTLLGILIGVVLIGFIVQGVMVANSLNVEGVTVQLDEGKLRSIISEEISKIPAPTNSEVVGLTAAEIAAEINVENADNALLNEFLESEFSDNYTAIEDEAYTYALLELEDHNDRVVVNFLMSLIDGIDEDSIDVYVDEFDAKVTKLGLEEDEDKSAIVTFELEVDYELEEGVTDIFNKDIVVVYKVVFDEGDFGDEDVELVSIN